MKTYLANKGLPFFFLAFSFIAFSGCDSNDPEDDAPDVIPSEVFALPVDLFDQSTSKASPPGANFTAAALRVWPVSLIISANLIIPSVTTLSALNSEPVFENGMWVWNASTAAEGQNVDFSLSAERTGDGTNWSMKISTTDSFTGDVLDDFELFSAQTTQNGTLGSWQLFYYLNGASQNVLNASYVYDSENQKAITFSIPETAAQGAGDSVEYTENALNRSFIWQQVAESITHTINWDATTLEGSISATNYNGGEMGCWDAELADIACSPS